MLPKFYFGTIAVSKSLCSKYTISLGDGKTFDLILLKVIQY